MRNLNSPDSNTVKIEHPIDEPQSAAGEPIDEVEDAEEVLESGEEVEEGEVAEEPVKKQEADSTKNAAIPENGTPKKEGPMWTDPENREMIKV